MQFYPENPIVKVEPSKENGELCYILVFPPQFISDITSKQDITIKYAFNSKWNVDPELKKVIRDMLVHILDIEHFQVEISGDKLHIRVPIKPLNDLSLLPKEGAIEIPIIIKLNKKNLANDDVLQFKCGQTICLITDTTSYNKRTLELSEMYLELPEETRLLAGPILGDNAPASEDSTQSSSFLLAQQNISSSQPENSAKSAVPVKEEKPEEEKKKRIYNGLMAIDFGTTNSVIVVRDPHYGAEEIEFDLSDEQWNSLIKWLDSWIIHHLSAMTPSDSDIVVDELIQEAELDISPLGSLSIDLWEDLKKMTPKNKCLLLTEVLSFLSMFDTGQYSPEVLKQLAFEVLGSFERVIYTKSLESQRYFVLELDRNAGPGPISSTLQIVAAPSSSEREKLELETEVEMGLRVNLLMRSAVMREADIRQFALNVKRYFGQNESIELVPAETASVPISFSDETLCRLAYKKLIERAVEDLKIRSRSDELEYADWVCTVVATFPTTYPASLRRKLRDILNEMEIREIDTRFDEGTASAIYYIWREICADPVCGIDGLIARCRQDRYGRAYQNILLYDLGGGTTDVALIQLIYEELPIFEPIDKAKYKNGRYSRITPRLLGSTGHRYIGGDLITLWLFRLVKTKLVDKFLSLLAIKKIEPPVEVELTQILANLPEDLVNSSGQYYPGSLISWTFFPSQNIRQYEEFNRRVIDRVIPTTFANETAHTPNFFTLWDLTEEAKKNLGNPIAAYTGSGLGKEWKSEVKLDQVQLWKLLIAVHPWLENRGIVPEDLAITISQKELYEFARSPVLESLSIAINMAKARLRVQDVYDKLDRFILSGLSCNLQVVQEEAKKIFEDSEKLFEFSLATVFFEQEVAKTSVAMGACIGRYLESVRLDPYDEHTRQMLRDGYDQVELVVENLFNYLTCRIVYGSLVAMVPMFDYGLPFNQRSYYVAPHTVAWVEAYDGKPVTRTPMDALRPVQEKMWIYRIDFEGASPQYLGLINAEAAAYKNGFDNFRKLRELYVVGFEADAELFIRAFFLPKGPKNILATHFLEDEDHRVPLQKYIEISPEDPPVLRCNVTSQELFKRKVVLLAGTKMENTIEYRDGSRYRCALSQPLPLREMYDVYLEDGDSYESPPLISHFHLQGEAADEIAIACDETGRVILLLSIIYDIKIWADMEYVPQKIDPRYDPFCGQH